MKLSRAHPFRVLRRTRFQRFCSQLAPAQQGSVLRELITPEIGGERRLTNVKRKSQANVARFCKFLLQNGLRTINSSETSCEMIFEENPESRDFSIFGHVRRIISWGSCLLLFGSFSSGCCASCFEQPLTSKRPSTSRQMINEGHLCSSDQLPPRRITAALPNPSRCFQLRDPPRYSRDSSQCP